MTLEEIFKKKPELLQEKEVQDLIKYVKDKHDKSFKIFKEGQDFYNFVLDKIMYSEIILLEGQGSHETLTDILQRINDD
jgi:hypothetical protein